MQCFRSERLSGFWSEHLSWSNTNPASRRQLGFVTDMSNVMQLQIPQILWCPISGLGFSYLLQGFTGTFGQMLEASAGVTPFQEPSMGATASLRLEEMGGHGATIASNQVWEEKSSNQPTNMQNQSQTRHDQDPGSSGIDCRAEAGPLCLCNTRNGPAAKFSSPDLEAGAVSRVEMQISEEAESNGKAEQPDRGRAGQLPGPPSNLRLDLPTR